jgi:hypothetical protein
MAMSQMATDCRMAHPAAGAGCQQDCCRYPLPQAVVRSAATAKQKIAKAPFLLAGPVVPQHAHPAFTAPPPGDLVAAAPARHVLLQVFRI